MALRGTKYMTFLLASLVIAMGTSTLALPSAQQDVHLAVTPTCGTLAYGGKPVNVNAGLPALSTFKTIVAFGDGYTDGGVHDGSPLRPAVLNGTSVNAGGRYSNGKIWVEYLAAAANATLKDYAVGGAVVDSTQWPGSNFGGATDIVTQVNTFIGQGRSFDPTTTLFTIFPGIGDFEESLATNQPGTLNTVAENIAYTILVLSSAPTFAKNILIVDNYGRGKHTAAGEAYKQTLFNGLSGIKTLPMNVGFVDFAPLWDGVLGDKPGYKAFGYTSAGSCVSSVGGQICDDADHTFYWIPEYPTQATHKIMADYVSLVVNRQC